MPILSTMPPEAHPWTPAVGDSVRIAYTSKDGTNELPPELVQFEAFIGHTGKVIEVEKKPSAVAHKQLSGYLVVEYTLPGATPEDLPRRLHLRTERFEPVPLVTSTAPAEEGLQKKFTKFVETMIPHGSAPNPNPA